MKCPKCKTKIPISSFLKSSSKKPLQCQKCKEILETKRSIGKFFIIMVSITFFLNLFAKGAILRGAFAGIAAGIASVYSTKIEERYYQYSQAIDLIVAESIKCLSSSWHYATLNIDCDGREVLCNIENNENGMGAETTDKLHSLCEDLYVLMLKNDDVWIGATLKVFKENDSWKHKIKFIYG